jgi:hypothetical protein
MNDGTQMKFLGCEQWKAIGQIETHLVAKNAHRSRSCPIRSDFSMGQHLVQQVEIGLHGVHLREVAVTVPTVPHTRWLHSFHEDVFPLDICVCAKDPNTHGVCHAQYPFHIRSKHP